MSCFSDQNTFHWISRRETGSSNRVKAIGKLENTIFPENEYRHHVQAGNLRRYFVYVRQGGRNAWLRYLQAGKVERVIELWRSWNRWGGEREFGNFPTMPLFVVFSFSLAAALVIISARFLLKRCPPRRLRRSNAASFHVPKTHLRLASPRKIEIPRQNFHDGFKILRLVNQRIEIFRATRSVTVLLDYKSYRGHQTERFAKKSLSV